MNATAPVNRLMDQCPMCQRTIPSDCEGVVCQPVKPVKDRQFMDRQFMVSVIVHGFWCAFCEKFWVVEQRTVSEKGRLIGPSTFVPPRLAGQIETATAHEQIFKRFGRTAPCE